MYFMNIRSVRASWVEDFVIPQDKAKIIEDGGRDSKVVSFHRVSDSGRKYKSHRHLDSCK